MNWTILKNQIDAANENLARINSKKRIGYMSQHNHTRITLFSGTEQQIKDDAGGTKLMLSYCTKNECSKFLTGFNAALQILES